MKSDNFTLAELERLLDKRRKSLDSLEKERSSLEAKLAQINADISQLTGRRGASVAAASTEKTEAAPSPAKAPRGRRRGRGGRKSSGGPSLASLVQDILKSNGPMLVRDMSKTILEGGYKTTSSNFSNVLYQTIHNLKRKKAIVQDNDGLYKLA